ARLSCFGGRRTAHNQITERVFSVTQLLDSLSKPHPTCATLLSIMKTVRGLLCSFFLLLSLSANAQWQRIVSTDKGGTPDTPAPHPLSYWTTDPIQRNESGDFCLGCHLENGHLVTP